MNSTVTLEIPNKLKTKLYILILFILFNGCQDTNIQTNVEDDIFKLLPSRNKYVAGEKIQLQFQGKNNNSFLWLSTAFGSTMLTPAEEKDNLTFTFPISFSQKSGSCYWRLVNDEKILLEGEVYILPNTEKTISLESFLGPKRIAAGGTDFSMLVAAPTDMYDNVLGDSTEINIHYQFKNDIEKATAYLRNGIGWKNIYSPRNSGRMLITTSHKGQSSKEMTTIVNPANAMDFNISYSRNHNYADGNQMITFTSDVIMDTFGNTVSDGTLVTFFVKNSTGALLKTHGTTINGIAKGSLLHPDKPEIWSVTAYITGTAKSNSLAVRFAPAVKDFKIGYTEDARTISIHQMQSFMGQLAPDGILVALEIRDEKGILLETMRATSREGEVRFILSKDFYSSGNYQLRFSAAGIIKRKEVTLQ